MMESFRGRPQAALSHDVKGRGGGAWRQRRNLETKVHGGWGHLGGGRTCPILWILPLAFFASRGGEHW